MKNYSFTINGKKYYVTIEGIEGKNADVTVNGKAYRVELDNAPAADTVLQSNPAVSPDKVASPAPVQVTSSAPAGNAREEVTSPLPGVIIEVSVKEGQTVSAGEKVAVLEAMKMENEITAVQSGTVTAIHVAKGDSVLEGAPIVTIA